MVVPSSPEGPMAQSPQKTFSVAAPPVLLLGDVRLKTVAAQCFPEEGTGADKEDGALQQKDAAHGTARMTLKLIERELHARLKEFRQEHGFGRAMAATQIDRHVRMIACNLMGTCDTHRPEAQPFTLCDPVVTWRSPETFTLWDDCMSFPDLLVRVRRHCSISLVYEGTDGKEYVWEKLGRKEAELLQHEMDHLDGVLAVELALDGKPVGESVDVVSRAAFEREKERYLGMVDGV